MTGWKPVPRVSTTFANCPGFGDYRPGNERAGASPTAIGRRNGAAESNPMETEIRERLLSGYKVMAFPQYLAGPAATRLMVEMGAEVIKVELAPRGDNTRATPYVKNG